MLGMMGYRSHSFASGADFLSAVLELEPGCIMLDVRMVGLSGLQVLRELMWMNLVWPVIIISGDLSSPLAAGAMATGAYALMGKPFEENDLQQILASAFEALEHGAVAV
jgi:two-component system response regulator FixJ